MGQNSPQVTRMSREELIRKLNSVGKQAFVEHFEIFQHYAYEGLTRYQAIEKLVKFGVSNEAGAGRRIGNARLIFKVGKEMDALSVVLDSKRLPSSVLLAAQRLKQIPT